MPLQAMTAPGPVSSQPTVQAYAAALRHTMPAVYVAAQDRHTHAGTVPLCVMPLTAQPSLCTDVQSGRHATMTALQP